jgi:rfaE bifunctional protein kinase chain/domain
MPCLGDCPCFGHGYYWGYIGNKTMNLLPLVDKLVGYRILVVGDVILDEYLIGRAERLSREAPIPVLEFERSELIPGGAANPSANITALGSTAIQVGVVGDDANAMVLRELLQERGIDPSGLIADAERPTTTKTRIMAQMGLRFPQQLARIDRIDRRPINGEIEQRVIACLRELAVNVDAIMVSDYMTGLLTNPIVSEVQKISHEGSLLATADAQGELDKYSGFDLIKCNADEAMRARPIRQKQQWTDEDFALAGHFEIRRLKPRGAILITRGPDGMTLIQADRQVTHIPAPHIEEVYDTVGAGDTVLAVATLALVAGASYPEAAALANLAAGIVVRRVGNYAPTPEELRIAITEAEESP